MTKPVPSPTRIPNFITRPMSWAYGLGIARVNKRFDRGVGVTKLEVPVISIGNLSAGGTGKSPTVHWVAREVQKLGKQPLIAMRGYKAQAGQMGDEEREHRAALPGVEVVAQSDRLSGIRSKMQAGAPVDCVILDDGFQHRQIDRDLDIVLIDASSPLYSDALLPRGFLRETSDSLARADAVLITHREMVGDAELAKLTQWVETQIPGAPVCISSHDWVGMRTYKNAHDAYGKQCWTEGPCLNQLPAGARVLGVCAIGNPEGFFSMIEQSQAELVGRIALRDHAVYDDRTAQNILETAANSGADSICMTRKDWVKAADGLLGQCPVPVWVPELGIRFESGDSELCELISKLFGVTSSGDQSDQ
tara:strand:+ start:162734 stop:163822 length:1089 start_codon:yes stop_codon:yes gene_type:complete